MSMFQALPCVTDCHDFHVVGNGRLNRFPEGKQLAGETMVVAGAVPVAPHDLIPGAAAVGSLDETDFHNFSFLPVCPVGQSLFYFSMEYHLPDSS